MADEASTMADATVGLTAPTNSGAGGQAIDTIKTVLGSITSLLSSPAQKSDIALLQIQKQMASEKLTQSLVTAVLKGQSNGAKGKTADFHPVAGPAASSTTRVSRPAAHRRPTALAIPFIAPAPGRLHARLSALIGRRSILLATIDRRLTRATRTTLKLKVSRLSKRNLASLRGRRVTAQIIVRYQPDGDPAVMVTQKVRLRVR
jgi:hypothetical protein